VLAYLFHTHDKVHLVTTAGCAVAAKAGPGTCPGIYLHARGLVIMEGTAEAVIAVILKAVVLQNGVYREALLDLC